MVGRASRSRLAGLQGNRLIFRERITWLRETELLPVFHLTFDDPMLVLIISYICGFLACWSGLNSEVHFSINLNSTSFPSAGVNITLAVENSSAFFRSFRISDLRTLARSSAQERSGSTLESRDSALFARTLGVCPLPDPRHDQLFLLHNFCAI